jgi:protein-S-isoprenylcysteine O-methyltransferase Ste14
VIWARVAFGRRSFHLAANPTEGGLVTTGPYRLIRHPIYTGVCLVAGAEVLAHLSWKAALLGWRSCAT